MKSFREYLEESVLTESTLVQLSHKTLSAMKSAFADQIKEGYEVYFDNDTKNGCATVNMAVPHTEGGEMFISIGFMTEENDQELSGSEKNEIGDIGLVDKDRQFQRFRKPELAWKKTWLSNNRLDKLDNLTAVFLSVNTFGKPLPDELAKEIISSSKFKSSLKKVMDVVTSETGVKPEKNSSSSTSFTYAWRIVSLPDLQKMAEKRFRTILMARSRHHHIRNVKVVKPNVISGKIRAHKFLNQS